MKKIRYLALGIFHKMLPTIAAVVMALGTGCTSPRATEQPDAKPAAPAAPSANGLESKTTADTRILQPQGKLWGQLPFFNQPVELSPEKPASVKKTPAARGTLLYGTIEVGDAPNDRFAVVLDREREGEDAEPVRRLYVDANRNGDLTDDGTGEWEQFIARGSTFKASTKAVSLRARYNSGETEDYSVYFVYAIPRPDGEPVLSYRRGGGRSGTVAVGDKRLNFVLIENNSRGLFNETGVQVKPLWLMLDANGDGAFGTEERLDARKPVQLGDAVFEVQANASGSKVTFKPTTAAAQTPPAARSAAAARPAAPRKPLLEVGTVAPDFTVDKVGGGQMKLSDLRGQVVVLDFWATWCGPCKASMPALEALHQKVKSQDVTVFGVCVWDSRAAFDKWTVEPGVTTTYLKAFDPAGVNRENANAESIAKKQYNVSGIPTFYVIDREGKIAASFVGNSPASKQGLNDTLAKLGVKL